MFFISSCLKTGHPQSHWIMVFIFSILCHFQTHPFCAPRSLGRDGPAVVVANATVPRRSTLAVAQHTRHTPKIDQNRPLAIGNMMIHWWTCWEI
jgi:hypothetical protein